MPALSRRDANRLWDNPNALTTIGTISKSKIEQISNGLLKENVEVQINKIIFMGWDFL